ncbi:MAG TPA: hypothetical protein ENN29_00840, partial [Candidatus Hydrogenedentes bacterium]|nr:hypothetical protein [Candidatus Hydrogenedentota bacterium]
MIASHQPDNYDASKDLLSDEAPTDFASLMASMPKEASDLPELRGRGRTDFASLNANMPKQRRVEMPNTLADHFINVVTPCLIFLLVVSALMFLLNVRFIYTAVHDMNLRWFSIFFVIGVVALNRLIARDGSAEAFIYAVALAGAVALYTLATTELYSVGAVTRNFMNNTPWIALLFNMAAVVFVWWLVNRLTHECCVDENAVAGDIGIFTATAERFRRTLRMAAAPPPPPSAPKHIANVDEPWHGIAAYDPLDAVKKEQTPRPMPKVDFSRKLPKRHPGMALFYFSAPVMILFSLGLRVIQHMGMPAVRMGAYYMYVYTFCVLALLTLTCLRQLRAYFRMRHVAMPPALPWLWLATAAGMILIIMWGAANLPMPNLPPVAYVDEHQVDMYNPQAAKVELLEVTPPSMIILQRWRFVERADRVAKAAVAALLTYAVVKGLQWLVALLLAKRNNLPHWLNRLITALAWLLFKMWPALMRWALPRRRIRIQRHVALSARYNNPLANPEAPPMPVRDHIAYAYDALRALATDVGMPPKPSMTPYEFLEN